ncbi:hypothetical protein [Tumebacillus permanentifrigoris]|uniref:Uncharacterized protein n=1 Tax=Tumebacillus permanentifrigoris TaxID=378543 RepID=A0A316D6Q2_9BACL|nr:hypothetical protein [Tumebacillus permanentifrigoris]PWK04989.1 hypothetical protein C7459_1303 [Tumebacillus permanentifrigoris]
MKKIFATLLVVCLLAFLNSPTNAFADWMWDDNESDITYYGPLQYWHVGSCTICYGGGNFHYTGNNLDHVSNYVVLTHSSSFYAKWIDELIPNSSYANTTFACYTVTDSSGQKYAYSVNQKTIGGWVRLNNQAYNGEARYFSPLGSSPTWSIKVTDQTFEPANTTWIGFDETDIL